MHVTIQGVGHVDQVDDDQVARVVTAVRSRLAELDPVVIRFGRPVVRPEAIALPALPASEVDRLRDTIRAALTEVLGAAKVPESSLGYQPHLSLAYSSGGQSAAPVIAALDAVHGQPVELEVTEASLIIQHRDDKIYEWVTRACAPIAEPHLL